MEVYKLVNDILLDLEYVTMKRICGEPKLEDRFRGLNIS